MRHYELVLIISPMLNQDESSAAWSRVKDFITSRDGEITYEQVWGTRRLAYPIHKGAHHFLEGAYHLTRFSTEKPFNQELEGFLRVDERVLRSLVVSTPDAVPPPPPAPRIAPMTEAQRAAAATAAAAAATPAAVSEAEAPPAAEAVATTAAVADEPPAADAGAGDAPVSEAEAEAPPAAEAVATAAAVADEPPEADAGEEATPADEDAPETEGDPVVADEQT